VLVLAGVERASLDFSLPSNPLIAEFMPYSHSLLGNAVAAALVWLVLRKRWGARRSAMVVALVVLSHWFLDLIMHRLDMTLAGAGPKLGLQLWNYPVFAQCFELGLLVLSFLVFRAMAHPDTRQNRAALIPLSVLVIVQLYSIFAPPPPTVTQMAVSLLVLWLVMPGLATWLEPHGSSQPK
jgi:membrane-bound metal-dependent hydrolase YbcI (DUF457 family)